jgi:hypothetical protein
MAQTLSELPQAAIFTRWRSSSPPQYHTFIFTPTSLTGQDRARVDPADTALAPLF